MIHTSRFADITVPGLSLVDYVFERAAEFAELPALIEGATGRALTYRALQDQVRAVGAGLSRRGFAKGDKVSIYSPNTPEYASVFFGVLGVGGVCVMSNPLYTADELARQLRDTDAKIIVTVPALAPKARDAAAQAGGGEVFVFGQAEGFSSWTELHADGPAPRVAFDLARDIAALPCSSGTTGLPKSVMLSHRNLVANLEQCEFIDDTGPGDHTIAVLPFFHIYGMVVILCMMLRRGACGVTMSQFDLESYLKLSQQYKVRRAYLVPPIALALTKHPMVDQFDLSSLKSVTSGAAPLGPELQKACSERLKCIVKQGYGMTEASPVTHFSPENVELVRAGSCGLLIPNTECRIIDLKTKLDVAPGESGELLIRGPQIMQGYLNNPEATAEALDEDGWLHTGDVGYADADGYFFIVDRLKEFIKYKGFQVAPAELEALLLTHPAIADAAVIPCANEEAGEIPKAFVVMRSPLTAEEVMAFVAERVASFKKIRAVEFTDKIPKSASGKILRRELIAMERAGTAT